MARATSDNTPTNDKADQVTATTEDLTTPAGTEQDASEAQPDTSENRDAAGDESLAIPDPENDTPQPAQPADLYMAYADEAPAGGAQDPIAELDAAYNELAEEGRLDSRTSSLFAGVIKSLRSISEQLDEIRAASSPR